MPVVTLEGRKSLKNNELTGLNSSKNTIGLAYSLLGVMRAVIILNSCHLC